MTLFDPEISRGTRIVQIIGAFIVLMIFAGVIAFMGIGWNNAANDARDAQGNYRAQVNKTETLQDEYNKLYKEFQQATGQKPNAASPEDVKQSVGQPGATGPKGDMGVTGQTGPKGDKGDAGAAGAPGATGTPGANGVNGDKGDTGATGAQGPTGPAGPQGPPGANGANGADGRGIQSMSCDGSGATSVWNVTYTDGSGQTIAGPCRIPLLP